MNHTYLVVIAGGSGTRFWPKSTSHHPKQFLGFGKSGKSLLEQTLDRFSEVLPSERHLIVTSELLAKKVKKLKITAEVLGEPEARNTAPCLFWTAKILEKKDPNSVMIVAPADHYVAKPEILLEQIKNAVSAAKESDALITLGIKPNRPETGYGYLQLQSPPDPRKPVPVAAFVEKPNLETAKVYLKDERYFWNSGMFVWRTSSLLKAFSETMPEMEKIWVESGGDVQKAYPLFPKTSIDYGVMEKASKVWALPLDCGWNDLGSWDSLATVSESLNLKQGENIVSSGELVAIDSRNNTVDAEGSLVSLLGVEDLIVVHHQGRLLVAHRSRAQDIRKIVEEVKKSHPDQI